MVETGEGNYIERTDFPKMTPHQPPSLTIQFSPPTLTNAMKWKDFIISNYILCIRYIFFEIVYIYKLIFTVGLIFTYMRKLAEMLHT